MSQPMPVDNNNLGNTGRNNLSNTASNVRNDLNQPGGNNRTGAGGMLGNNDLQSTEKSYGSAPRPLDNNQGSMFGNTGRNNNQGSMFGSNTGYDNNQTSMFGSGRDNKTGDSTLWNSSNRSDNMSSGYGNNTSSSLGGLGQDQRGDRLNNPSGFTGVGSRNEGGLIGSSHRTDATAGYGNLDNKSSMLGSTASSNTGYGNSGSNVFGRDNLDNKNSMLGSSTASAQGPTAGHGNTTGFGNTGTTTSGMGNNTSGYGTATGHTTGPTTGTAGLAAGSMLGRNTQSGNLPQQQQQAFPGQQQNLTQQQQNLGQQQQFRGGETVMDRLIRDHNEIAQIAREFRSCTMPDERYTIAMNFIRAVSIHAFAEEMAIYPLYEKHFATGRELAARSRKENNEIKKELSSMTTLKNNDAELEARMTRVMQSFEEHKQHEETNELPMLMSSLGQEESVKVGEDYEKYKSKAPTRPHPGAPDKGGFAQAAAGMAARPIDSMKDMASRN